MQKVRKAVIPVAGYGTRFLPFTKAVPKPMLPILNKPALQIISEEVVNSGITDILFIVGYKKEVYKRHILLNFFVLNYMCFYLYCYIMNNAGYH